MDSEKVKILDKSLDSDSAIPNFVVKRLKLKYILIFFISSFLITHTIIVFILNNAKDNFIFKLFNNYFQRNSYYKNEIDKMESLRRGQDFFNLCIKGELIKDIPKDINLNEKPLISVVIPVYNTKDKIKSVIRSAQNQNISNIEIVLVNDFSNDETIKIIDDIKKEDKRIESINNKKNMGTLYSRCIGTLKAKGKYIFPLDNDDFFFDESLFSTITNEAEKGNFDIIEFKGASRVNYDLPPNSFQDTNYSNHKHGLILYQPELSLYSRKRGNQFGVYDCFLWAKCIRNEVYKTTINLIGKNIYKRKIIWGEDLITSFVLFRVAKSFKFIGIYGIFRYLNINTATYHTSESLVVFSKIIYLYIILKFTENSYKDKKYVFFRAFGFINSFKTINLSKRNKIYLKEIVKLILDNDYISVSDKNKIKSAFLDLKYSNKL